MGRIRSIKPEAPQSESLGRVSRDARLLFFMLFTIADDEGRARGNSRMLASLLFPYDDDAPKHIPEWLMELEREKCVLMYHIDENIYLQIVKWADHQKIDHPTKSKLPAPPEPKKPRERKVKPREPSRNLAPDLRKGEEGKGKDTPVPVFNDFWDVCPRKVGKITAQKAWARALEAGAIPETVVQAMRAFGAEVHGTEEKYIPHPATWLNGGRWTDEKAQPPPGAQIHVLSDEVKAREAENLRKLGIV